MDFTADGFPGSAGAKRRYAGGSGEMMEAVGDGQLVPVAKKQKEGGALVPKLNDQQQLLTTENRSSTLQVCVCCFY